MSASPGMVDSVAQDKQRYAQFSSIVPTALTDYPNWVNWRYEGRHGQTTKIPYQSIPCDGDPKARSNDPSTWASFADATAMAPDFDGIGFMLVGSPFTGVDFDGVAPGKVIDPYVASVLKVARNPYAEFSPSGEGVRLFFEGTKLPNGKRKFSAGGSTKFGAEIYSGAETGRYLTVTADKVPGSNDSIPKLDEWTIELVYVLVSQILNPKFKALWVGDEKFIADTYNADRSSADAALVAMLVPLLNRDAAKIEAAFTASALGQREKWTERKDYRDRTIKNALALPPLESGVRLGGKEPGTTSQDKYSQPPSQAQEPAGREMTMTRADSLRPEITPWLWPQRIVANNINVFAGEPDMGKGLTWVDFVARLTTHQEFPDCPNDLPGPTDVAIMSSEDDNAATVVPRLIAAGADLTHVHFVTVTENVSGTLQEGIACLDRDLPTLEELLTRIGIGTISLVIVDPIIAFLGDADPNKDRDVRPIFTRMKAFAKKNRIAWLTVNHFNKNQLATSINRTSGAKTFVSAPRCTWLFDKDPDDPTRRLMMKGKGNLAKQGLKTLAYRINEKFIEVDGKPHSDAKGRPVGVPVVLWEGETDHTADDVLQADADSSKKLNKKAEELITRLLNESPTGVVLASAIYDAGESETPSINSQKLKRAKANLDVEVFKLGERWYWARDRHAKDTFKTEYFQPGKGVILPKP